MAFGIDTNTQKADAGFIKGKQREIACQCWFISKGKVIPLMLDVQLIYYKEENRWVLVYR